MELQTIIIDENKDWYERSGPPNTMDKLPYGSRIRVSKGPTNNQFYIQSSKDEDNPNWIHLGPFQTEIQLIHPDE